MAQRAFSIGPKPSIFFGFFFGFVFFSFLWLLLIETSVFSLKMGIFVYFSVSPFVSPGPFCQGNFRHKMKTIVENRGQLWTITLSPHFAKPPYSKTFLKKPCPLRVVWRVLVGEILCARMERLDNLTRECSNDL